MFPFDDVIMYILTDLQAVLTPISAISFQASSKAKRKNIDEMYLV